MSVTDAGGRWSRTRYRAGLLCGCGLLLAPHGPAKAQSSGQGVNANPGYSQPVHAAPRPGPRIEDVVVTAQRTRQSLTQSPVAVTFISPATTRNLDIRSIHDIADVTPGVSFSSGFDYAQVYIRGLGVNSANPGLEFPVAIYQDDVYQSSGNNAILNLLDPASVQVLNGPQGTLFGRNASGGVILLNTADPTKKEEASLYTELGRFGHEQVDATINQPISPDVRLRIAARFLNDDGYIHNEYDGHTLGGGQTKQIRGKLDWTPSAVPGLDILASTEYSYTNEHRDIEQERLQAPLCLTCIPAFGGATPPGGFYDTNQNSDGPFKKRNFLNIIRATYDIGPYSLKSVTSYQKTLFEAPTGSDQDYTTVNFFNFLDYVPEASYAEDISLQSNYRGPLNFISGFTYIRDQGSFDAAFKGLAFGNLVPRNSSNVRTDSTSAFIEANYKVTRRLTFIAGMRYNIDRRTLDTQNNEDAALIFGDTGFAQRVKYYSLTPRGIIQYKTGVGNFYVSETKGFKAGGVNTPALTPAPPIGPEKIRSEEIGLKSRLMDGRLQTAVDFFHYVDDGLQEEVTDANSGGAITKNAGSAEAYGVEGSGKFAATDNLIIGFGGDYLHARFTSYDNPALFCPTPSGLVGCSYNISGQPLPHAPAFTGFLTAEYSFPITKVYTGAIAVAAHYTSTFGFYSGNGGPLDLDRQKGYELININGWITPGTGRYRIGFYVDNATNRRYNDLESTSAPYGAITQAAMPLSAGVKLQYNFQDW